MRDPSRAATTELDFIRSTKAVEAQAELTTTPAGQPLISVRRLNFAFPGKSARALRDIDVDIFPGEFIVVAGPSGCGKSTLSMALAGHIPHVIEGRMSGDVCIDGTNTRELELCDIAVKVALCQQDPETQFCTLSVDDEVAFGPENLALPLGEVLHRRDEALAAVDGLHLKGREPGQLSGGEQQRVAIAAMLAMCPQVLILDEPTSSLDPGAAEQVWAAIEKLRVERKMTIIVVEHKLDRLLALADRLIVMDSGAIVLDGPSGEVRERYLDRLRQPTLWPAVPPVRERGDEAGDPLQVRDLRFAYAGKEVLQGVSLEAGTGEFIGIIGENGSGKTTFLTCLTGLNRPFSGEIRVGGMAVADAQTSAIARQVGFVFQNPNHQLFEDTVADEMTFACRNFGIDAGGADRRIMDGYGLAGYASCHPFKLSHGEKRRLNLGSVLPHNPNVILLDEPFIGQDLANTARIVSDLLRLKAAGKTILMVAHDLDVVFRYCDRVVFFEAGRILADDVPARARAAIAALGRPAFVPREPQP
jgi:energy-coupling factor transport system ATP-binding protein